MLSACGSSSSSTPKPATVILLMGVAPDSLDPGVGNTTQAAEPDWLSYLGLDTYAHSGGMAGTTLIPALATDLPTISDGGTTYTATLRAGLVFSNGQPVKASDFAYTVERAVKIPGGAARRFLAEIKGATAYTTGKARTISGITTNNATGQITIHLNRAFGAFDNVLALPSLGIIPAGTPFKNEPNHPPPGVGPYEIRNVVPHASFRAVMNPYWPSIKIPGIPAGHVNVDVKIDSNVAANAMGVLGGSADLFDWADMIPTTLLPLIKSHAGSRFNLVDLSRSTDYIFLNTKAKPFSSQLAREAVVAGLDVNAIDELASGTLVPACYLIPPAMVGHPTVPCPYGNPASGGDVTKAKALVKQSGMAGVPVTVWSETGAPGRQWMIYYTSFLNQIGFRATQKTIPDATYFKTIGTLKLGPQTGFAYHNEHFPNPVGFYELLTGHAIRPVSNENLSQVDDPYINAEVSRLGTVPASLVSAIASQWQTVDEYTAKKAYAAVLGYPRYPEFTSERINRGALTFHHVYGWDWSSFELK